MKCELHSEVEKPNTENQGPDAVEHAPLACKGWKHTQRYQKSEWQDGLQSRNTRRRGTMRQNDVARAIVVVTVHPGDRHEMRKLPEENHQEESPCFNGELTARCGPADQGRHSAWNGTNQMPPCS